MTGNEKWTLAIAIYAAFVSTAVFIWDVIKWFKVGPKLSVSASYGMAMIGGYFDDPNERYVMVKAVNRGDRPTTITNMGFLFYSTRLKAIFRSKYPDKAMVVSEPNQAQKIPYKLDGGEQWSGLATQDNEILEMIRQGTLYAAIYHSASDKCVKVRIPPKK